LKRARKINAHIFCPINDFLPFSSTINQSDFFFLSLLEEEEEEEKKRSKGKFDFTN
jgi:hypothetical protein